MPLGSNWYSDFETSLRDEYVQGGRQRGDAIAWYATLALPAMAVLVVGYAVLGLGRPRPVLAARIRGGPTEGVTALSFRIEGVLHSRDEERPLVGERAVVQAALASGETLTWEGVLDDEGAAEVSLRPSVRVTGPVRVRATAPTLGREARAAAGLEPRAVGASVTAGLIDDTINLTAAEWSSGARHRGGWLQGNPAGTLAIRVAASRGAFAVPYRDPLVVDVRRDGKSLEGASVRLSSEGADVEPKEAITDARGRVVAQLLAHEHAVSLTVHARAPNGDQVEFETALEVVPGALHAAVSDGVVVVESPVVHERAYVTVVRERERILGRALALAPDAMGGARGTLPLSEGLGSPSTAGIAPATWIVVSSEADQRSAALVGWPIAESSEEPRPTFDVADVLLADGVAAARARESERVGRVRLSAATIAVALLALAGVLVVFRVRGAERDLAAHIDESLADSEATTRMVDSKGGRSSVVVALVCVALGAVLIAVFALWR